MVRALGIVIAGLPLIPWFIESPWHLAFGVLPPYWAAKAFWVASAGGTWWPYLFGRRRVQRSGDLAAVPPVPGQALLTRPRPSAAGDGFLRALVAGPL
jgi:hypothetical protein